jgi:serine/threonine protein kinase
VLPATKADNPAALGRFYREARAAGVLDHPNLVKAHDIDQDGGLHFLVMDYVDGTNLQEIVARFGPMPPARAAHCVCQAAEGLQHAHERAGVIHRDIKPANILLDRTGTVRVLDLGLARFFHDDADLLTLKYDEKNVLGTADYVSPEQALNSHDVDIRADIYSLGATFYFLLTGQPPFPGGKAAQKLVWHQVRQPTPVRELRPDVPPGMAAVVTRMLAKKPDERYQTPAEVIVALAEWTGEPPPPPSEEEMPHLSLAAARSLSTPEIDAGPPTPPGEARPSGLSGRASPTPPGGRRSWEADSCVPLLVQRPPQRKVSMAELATPRALASSQQPTDTDRPRSPKLSAQAAAVARPRRAAAPAARRGPALHLAVILAVGAVVGVGLRLGVGRLRIAAQDAGPATHVVGRSGQPGAFASVREALAHARPGDRVQIAEETWEESLELAGDLGREVVVEGAAPGDKPVVWRAPRSHRDESPLVSASCVGGLMLRKLTLDGQDRVQELVALAGPCPGLTLEDVQLVGFRRAAVRFSDCAGGEGRPVTLQRLRVVPARAAAAALRFEAAPEGGNRAVRVADCRLEGPYQAAVTFAGPAAEVEMVRNRVYNAADGVVYRKAAPPAPLGLALTSNTFCEIEKAAVRFETTPPLEDSRVIFTNNLFARTGTVAAVDDFRPQPSTTAAQWVWYEETRPAGEVPAEYRYFRKAFAVDGQSVSRAVLNVAADQAFTVWLNGTRLAHGELLPHLRRVHAFDVARYLRPGLNVLAVQGATRGGPAGVLAQLTWNGPGAAPVTVVSDGSWKTSRNPQENWQKTGFDDARWPEVKVVAPYGKGAAGWQNLVWDEVVIDHFAGRAGQLFPEPTGNARDWTTQEAFPPLKAVALNFDLPTDAADDARFLRYTRASVLGLAGSPGVPPADAQADDKKR